MDLQGTGVGSATTVSGLLNTLRKETVHLLQQGDDLSTQMAQLYRSVDDFVHSQLHPIPRTPVAYSENISDTEPEPLTGEDSHSHYPRVHSGYDSGYNTAQLIGREPLTRTPQWQSTSQVKKVTREMSSGSRFKSSVGDPGQGDIPEGSALDSLDSGLNNKKSKSQCYSYKADLLGCCCSQVYSEGTSDSVGPVLCSCYNSQDSSPVTVSSGYSSDKDSCGVREEDIDNLLGHGKSGCSGLNEDTLSCCDSELVHIYETCKQLGRPLSENYQDDSLIGESVPENEEAVKEAHKELSHREFVPINYESLCQQGIVHSDLSSVQKECVNYTPLYSQTSDTEDTNSKGSRDRTPIKKTSLRRHHSMFERHSKPYICVAQSVDNKSDISPPPITALPGFHPAWCGSQEEDTDNRHSHTFAISHCSAFRPYGPGLTRSLSEKDLSSMYEVPISVRDTIKETVTRDGHCTVHQGHPEPLYSLVKSVPKRTLTYSCSSDSGNSSSGYCIESQSPALSSSDEGIFESPERSVLYEPIDDDPIYEYVPSGCYTGRFQFQDTPPKLPKRNPVTRRQKASMGERSSEKRKRPVKLEDIVRPSDIVDAGGKHLYTVADVLESVEKLAQDMPVYANDTAASAYPCEKLQRSSSCVAALSNRSHVSEDIKGFKRIFSPRSAGKPKRSTSHKVGRKDSPVVKEGGDSHWNTEEKPESVHGLLVIPTLYGLQFKSSVQCTPQTKVKHDKVNAGRVTTITNCSNSISLAWNSLSSSSKEIFC